MFVRTSCYGSERCTVSKQAVEAPEAATRKQARSATRPATARLRRFRGTVDTNDTYTNLQCRQCDFEPVYAQGKVHAGWYDRASCVNYEPIASLRRSRTTHA